MLKKKIIIILVGVFVMCGAGGYAAMRIVKRTSETDVQTEAEIVEESGKETKENTSEISEKQEEPAEINTDIVQNPALASNNYTTTLGPLMLINPNFPVDEGFISMRSGQLIDITATYGIVESNVWNGTPMLDAEAAEYLNEMLLAYAGENPGHTMQTLSCFRSVGTSCGRLCVATGGSDHHSGYTCDLHDPAYGGELNTDLYESHPEWQWLYENSYKYGFISRFPLEWAGGSMDEPANIDATGTTGLYETWHYRYVGVMAATEIATGKYNNGEYDSLEHYLLMRGLVTNLLDATSCAF